MTRAGTYCQFFDLFLHLDPEALLVLDLGGHGGQLLLLPLKRIIHVFLSFAWPGFELANFCIHRFVHTLKQGPCLCLP